jgi:hypothetical protein
MVKRGDFVRYGTVDSSPQGPYDFVLHGARTLSGTAVLQAARDSDRLHDDSLTEDEKKLITERLRSALLLTQGAPCAVGAGRQSLARKVHAVVHSTRMYASSWRAAVSLMNGTFTWTGDQGVESGFWLFRRHMKNLFGRWPMEADAMPDDEDPCARAHKLPLPSSDVSRMSGQHHFQFHLFDVLVVCSISCNILACFDS